MFDPRCTKVSNPGQSVLLTAPEDKLTDPDLFKDFEFSGQEGEMERLASTACSSSRKPSQRESGGSDGSKCIQIANLDRLIFEEKDNKSVYFDDMSLKGNMDPTERLNRTTSTAKSRSTMRRSTRNTLKALHSAF